MPIPSMKRVRQAKALQNKVTICCIVCKEPLWELYDIHQYGTKTGARKVAMCGNEWSDYWSKDNKTPLKLDCPKCHEPYLQAIQGPNGTLFPKIYIKEIDGIS